MAIISGENGAVYYNAEVTDIATTGSLVFSTGKTINSCGAGAMDFVTEGYTTGMLVTISGCTNEVGSTGSTTGNNKIFTITVLTSGQLTVSETVIASNPEEGAVTFKEAEPGVPVLGFFNWTLSQTADTLEISDFDDSSGARTYIPGLASWTVTADKHFLTTGNTVDDWVGETCEIRLFINYVATPSTGSPSQYWDGDTVVTGLDGTTPVDALINESISFQGDGALTLKTQTKAWNLGIST